MKMKVFFQITIFLTLFEPCKGQITDAVSRKKNHIDSIQTVKQINDLISNIDKSYEGFIVNRILRFSDPKCQNLSDSLKVQPWTKADFDNNGLTDILVIGSWDDHPIICILDKGGKYEIYRIARHYSQNCTFPIVDNNNIIFYFKSKPEWEKWEEPQKIEQITFTYKFGDFIEENQKPATHKIEKIEYSTTMCYGTCPVFKITINSDKTAKWEAEMFNELNGKEVRGNFKAKIKKNEYDNILNLLNYIDFETLQDNYAVNWTDEQSAILKITYDDGKVKTIEDYGLIGTGGLEIVHWQLFGLRENQKWKKIH